MGSIENIYIYIYISKDFYFFHFPVDNFTQGNLMQRMTDALSRMLNDPSTRLAMRTLGEREGEMRDFVASGNNQSSESQQQPVNADDENHSNNNQSQHEVEPNADPRSPQNTNDRDVREEDEMESQPSLATDQSVPDSAKLVPDITIEDCNQGHVQLPEESKASSQPCEQKGKTFKTIDQGDTKETNTVSNDQTLPDSSDSVINANETINSTTLSQNSAKLGNWIIFL